jgi:hypothetical protein
MPTTPAAARAEVIEFHEETDAQHAARANEEVAAYREGVGKKLATFLAGQELRIRLTPSDLIRWLEDGERLTFHTTGITNGYEDIHTRRTIEHEMMGVPLEAAEEDRPRYGYVRGGLEGATELNGYGNVVIRLTDDLRERATVVLGDSIGSSTRNRIPLGCVCMVAERLANTDDLLCRFPDQDVAGADQLHQACDPRYQYAEAQIYDPLVPDTITQVVFCNGERATGELRRLMASWGLIFDEINGVLD